VAGPTVRRHAVTPQVAIGRVATVAMAGGDGQPKFFLWPRGNRLQ